MLSSTQSLTSWPMLITKSKFLAGTQCLKRLYWIVHSPEMAAQRDESDQSIIEQGRQVGLLAQQMFPSGVTVEGRDREEAIRMTRELIANPAVPAIFEVRSSTTTFLSALTCCNVIKINAGV
jgi:hypothetical protein